MARLNLALKLTNTFATFLLLLTQPVAHARWYTGPKYDEERREYSIALLGVLHFLLIGLTIYQWLPKAPKDALESIGYWYVAIAVLHSAVSLLWFFRIAIFPFVVSLWLVAMLGFVYGKMGNYPPRNRVDLWFVNLPFSVYLAYGIFMCLNHIFEFSDSNVAHSLVYAFDGFVALHLVDYSHRHDWAFALSMAWLLFGTGSEHPGTPTTLAFIAVGILLSAVARTLIPHWIESAHRRFGRLTRHVSERTPLLQ